MSQQQAFSIVSSGGITSPQGFLAGGLHCGLKKTDRHDLGLIWCKVPASVAGVFTRNVFQAAPLKVTKDSIASSGKMQAMLVNSGNANACTGEQGDIDAFAMRASLASAFQIDDNLVGVTSTGVIGQLLPMPKVLQGIAQLPGKMKSDLSGSEDFCQAILTTDLVQKMVCVSLPINGQVVHIAGAAKGSGMIHPNMATMLGFITTDANIESEHLQSILGVMTERTFNMVSVDGDTSTNDMVIAMASGLVNHQALQPNHRDWNSFVEAFYYVCEYLAKAIARDGEGATKLVEVHVHGAVSDVSAQKIAKTVMGSSLVKTAIFGADANWGRIIAAIGRAEQPVNIHTVDIQLGDIQVLKASKPVQFDEPTALAYLMGDFIQIHINMHMGEGKALAWGCDLTYDYIKINAAYRT
jgi:glutamate N-acetyltransferase/amino-acid N-acetyltransferase